MIFIHRCRFDLMGENWGVDEETRGDLNELGRRDPLAAALLGPILERQQEELDRFGNVCRCFLDDDGEWIEGGCPEHRSP